MSNSNLEQRIAAWLEGRISEADSETLQQELRDSVEARTTFKRFAQLDAVLREVADTESIGMISQASGSSAPIQKTTTIHYIKGALAIAAGIAVMLTVNLYYQYVNANRNIARITGLNGTLSWIGDGGQIVQGDTSQQTSTRWSNTLSEGAELPGGTIEGMAPDSWFKLKFHDGSTGMISGDSILTFSDQGQKELRLRQGRFSADVMPQLEGKPMLIHTSVAVLKVIGTQFDVEAGPESTMLYVREGIVQMLRVHDGKMVDVPANHRVVTTANSDMLLQFVAPERMWIQTPVWENISSSGDQNSIATQEIHDHDGTRNLLVSEEAARLPAQDTEYTIRSGDLFEFRFVWMAGMWWTPQDQIALKLFTTDNDLISGTPTTFATILSGTLIDARAYESASGSATATATEARKRLFIAIDTEDGGGELNGIAHLDNFQLQVTHFPEPGLPRLDDFRLQGTPFPDPLPPPAAEIIIGGNIRNGNFNEN
ncbi:MAG: FecR domain-containing protein [Planctomycetaceae bacterium]|nr:FecR domain-containing protein [Planctomycetaceae bacterium]